MMMMTINLADAHASVKWFDCCSVISFDTFSIGIQPGIVFPKVQGINK